MKRWIILIAAVIELVLFGGYHYGYNALIEPYKELGVFSRLCANETRCVMQEKMFHYGFIVWVVSQMCLITGAGIIMDRFGLRILKLVAASISLVGTLMFAFTSAHTSEMFFIAGILVALGSTSSVICNHQISSLFPRYRGLVISVLAGAFDSSTLVTFVIAKTAFVVSLRTYFIAIACCGFVYGLLMAFFALTKWAEDMGKHRSSAAVETGDKDNKDMVAIKDPDVESDAETTSQVDSKIQSIILRRYPTVRSCIVSWPFVLVSLWFMIGLLRFSYFLNQMGQQLQYMFGDDVATIDELRANSSAMLMFGILISPISGCVLDCSKTFYRKRLANRLNKAGVKMLSNEIYWSHLRGLAPAFLLMAIAALAFSTLNFVKSKVAFYASILFLVILRSLLFSASINFVLIGFPVRNFGTVNGIMNTIGGIFSLLQYALLELTAIPGNAVSLGIATLLFVTPLVLFFKRV